MNLDVRPYDAERALRAERNALRQELRVVADRSFDYCRERAEDSGLSLTRRGSSVYVLTSPDGWTIEIDPGLRLIWRDPAATPRAPFLRLAPSWVLCDVVDAAAAVSSRRAP